MNVCDTAAHPDEIGIRAALPAARAARGVRFRVQYREAAERALALGARPPTRGWRKARRARESGWSFEVAGDGTRILRGVVNYRWKRKGEVVRRARRVTELGHRSTAGADPADFSAATCRIT